jgi:hypothetical protein
MIPPKLPKLAAAVLAAASLSAQGAITTYFTASEGYTNGELIGQTVTGSTPWGGDAGVFTVDAAAGTASTTFGNGTATFYTGMVDTTVTQSIDFTFTRGTVNPGGSAQTVFETIQWVWAGGANGGQGHYMNAEMKQQPGNDSFSIELWALYPGWLTSSVNTFSGAAIGLGQSGGTSTDATSDPLRLVLATGPAEATVSIYNLQSGSPVLVQSATLSNAPSPEFLADDKLVNMSVKSPSLGNSFVFSKFEVLAAGESPPAAPLSINSISASSSSVSIDFTGAAGTTYTVEHSTDPTGDRFDPMAPELAIITTGDNGNGEGDASVTIEVTDTTNFYRIKEGSHYGKRGIGSNFRSGSASTLRQALIDLEVSWFYHWWHTGPWEWMDGPYEDLPEDIEFVPMVWGNYLWWWGDEPLYDEIFAEITASPYTHLLGFNEPDHMDQSDMSVADAIAMWPDLMATGKRLGSPSPAGRNNTVGGWLENFMNQCANLGYRVDFICIHIYQDTPNLNYVLDYCEEVYEKYGLPIWITEWSLANWDNLNTTTEAEQVAYFKMVTEALENVPYVERHAWFSLADWTNPSEGIVWDMGMVDEVTGALTPVGKAMLDLNDPDE